MQNSQSCPLRRFQQAAWQFLGFHPDWHRRQWQFPSWFRCVPQCEPFFSLSNDEQDNNAHADSNVLARSQTITGRFFLSLYVGKMTEYLSVAVQSQEGQKELISSVWEDTHEMERFALRLRACLWRRMRTWEIWERYMCDTRLNNRTGE